LVWGFVCTFVKKINDYLKIFTMSASVTKISISLILFGVLFFGLFSCKPKQKYKDLSLSFEERVDDLISRMTLEEKVSQLSYTSPAIAHLGIPEYNWWNECLHGVGRAGIATVFPQAIGMAAMWDDSTLYNTAIAISDEARAKHHEFVRNGKRGIYQGLTFWTPNINIFRDPRWGRGMETYGEDPYLTGELAVSFIKGLQGNHPKYLKLIATAKHFVVHSGPELSRHSFNALPNMYDFLETYTPHFKKAIQKADVYSIMCAYNRYNNLPCCGHPGLDSLMRNHWGFKGYVVSDCWAIRDFYYPDAHEIVNTKAEASALALRAGTDLNCGDSYPSLVEAVQKGYVTEKEIDKALRRLLLARMKLGMFDADRDVPFASIPYSVVDSETHQKLALDAALKSMVLLENKNNVLPFSKNVKKIAVIGPNADNVESLLANYNGFPSNPITPLKAIQEKFPEAEVLYAQGCQFADGLPYLVPVPNDVLYTDASLTAKGLKAEYFSNKEFVGKPSLSRTEKNIDFAWWNAGPGVPLKGNRFSARYTGFMVPKVSGMYAIGFEGHPTVKLKFDTLEFKEFHSVHHGRKIYEHIYLEKGRSYSVNIEFVQDGSEYAEMHLLWEEPGKNRKAEAIDIAAKADVIVLCMGLSPMIEGEEMPVNIKGFLGGDRTDIDLPEVQADLIKSITSLGKPTTLVLMNGSALAFDAEKLNIKAVLEAWYPGQSGGTAIADVLFGDYNPAGRLPVTFYNSVGQIPAFDDYNMEGRTYRYFTDKPLYEFGHGLSYTTFNYGKIESLSELEAGKSLLLEVEVSNTGKMAGEEVVQLYVSHLNSTFRTPIRSLKGFKRISLQAGESKKVKFEILPEDIAVLNKDYSYVIETGKIIVSIGGGQPTEKNLKDGKAVKKELYVKAGNGIFKLKE
jgi:beta-glucosidase